MNESITAYLGLNSKRFQDGIAAANRRLAGLEGALSKVGIAGGLFFAVNAFRSLIQSSREAEYGIDENVDAVKRLDAQFQKLSKGVTDFFTATIGGLVRFGEGIGDTISVAMGATYDELEAIKKSEREIIGLEEKLSEIKQRNKKLGEDAVKAEEKLAESRKRAAFDALSDDAKLLELQRRINKEREGIQQQQDAHGGGALSDLGRSAVAQHNQAIFEAEQQIAALQAKSEARRKSALDEVQKMEAELARSQLSDSELLEDLQARRLENDKLIARWQKIGLTDSEGALALRKENLSLTKDIIAIEERAAAAEQKNRDDIARAEKALFDFRESASLSEMSAREKISSLDNKITENAAEILRLRTSGKLVEALNLELESARLSQEKLRTEKEINNEIKARQKDLSTELMKYRDIQESLNAQIRSRYQISLSDAASGKYGRGTASKAKRVDRLEERAKQYASRGNDEKAREMIAKADEVRGSIRGLSDSESDPSAILREQLEVQREQIEKIDNMVQELTKLRTEPVA